MLQKSWNAVTLICGNHKGDQSHPMKLQQGPHSLFFSCPEYKSIYGDDHEGRSCNNRLTLVDYEKLLDYLTERTYAGDGLQETNLTGLKFTLKVVDYEVLEQKRFQNKNDLFVKEHVCLHALFFVPILPSHNTLQLEFLFSHSINRR